jgi:hypothetical protein
MNPAALCAATVWRSHAHAAAIKADPNYPTYMQERDALVAAPIYEVHVHFSGDLLCALDSPVTGVVYYTRWVRFVPECLLYLQMRE